MSWGLWSLSCTLQPPSHPLLPRGKSLSGLWKCRFWQRSPQQPGGGPPVHACGNHRQGSRVHACWRLLSVSFCRCRVFNHASHQRPDFTAGAQLESCCWGCLGCQSFAGQLCWLNCPTSPHCPWSFLSSMPAHAHRGQSRGSTHPSRVEN